MSVKAMAKVFEADLVDQDFRALIAMADHADDEGGSIFPSIEWLAWKIGKSERQTQRIVRRMRDLGYLVLVRPARRTRPNEYKLVFTALPAKPPFKRGLNEMPAGMRESVIAEGDQVCALCGVRGDADTGPDGQPWNVDRIVPAADGGRYEWGNVRLACGTCNRQRDHRRGATHGTPVSFDRGTPRVPLERHPSGATWMAPEPSVEPSENHPSANAEGVAASPPPNPDVERLCQLMSTHVRQTHGIDPSSKIARVSKTWRDACRAMLELDGRTDRQIEFAIAWVCRHHFWRHRIKSMPRLRSEWEEVAKDIRLQRDRSKAQATDPLAGLSPSARARMQRSAERLGTTVERLMQDQSQGEPHASLNGQTHQLPDAANGRHRRQIGPPQPAAARGH